MSRALLNSQCRLGRISSCCSARLCSNSAHRHGTRHERTAGSSSRPAPPSSAQHDSAASRAAVLAEGSRISLVVCNTLPGRTPRQANEYGVM
jgi:hypothetical protein